MGQGAWTGPSEDVQGRLTIGTEPRNRFAGRVEPGGEKGDGDPTNSATQLIAEN